MNFKHAYSVIDYKGQEFSHFEDKLGYFFDEDGERKFGIIGQTDVFSEIQRYKDVCQSDILKSYLLAHSSNKDLGLYGERPQLFSDVNEMAMYLEHVNSLYDTLPEVVKSKYKNMFEVVNNFSEEDLSLLETSSLSNSSCGEVEKDE